MDITEFDYTLPQNRIAQYPAYPKSYARMLVVNGGLSDYRFYEIRHWFREGDVLVLNDTKVSRVKLSGHKHSGSPVGLILMRPQEDGWVCRIKGRNVQPGVWLHFPGRLSAKVVSREEDTFFVRFNRSISQEYLAHHATLPTPPYIRRQLQSSGEYQTAYARHTGSLAAPTAGLHFTPHLLRRIRRMGVTIVSVCLHVGFGTFTPVQSGDITQHRMEPEWLSVSEEVAESINRREGRLFVVGTTTMRTLETAADGNGAIHPWQGYSDLFITPGYRFKVRPYGFITNFHLPRSTLLLLVSAYAGWERIRHAYEHAVASGYRFFSLGDCMLLENIQPQ